MTEENNMEPNNQPTQSGERLSQGLNGVRERARKNKQERFTALLHHVTPELLRESYYGLKRKAAPGVLTGGADARSILSRIRSASRLRYWPVTWKEYETGLEDRLNDLHGRVHRGAYRASPSKRVFIPKANGKQRPLGIAALEDKIVQSADQRRRGMVSLVQDKVGIGLRLWPRLSSMRFTRKTFADTLTGFVRDAASIRRSTPCMWAFGGRK